MHSNSILICFCSILYYRDLAEHIRRYKIEKEIVKTMEIGQSGDEKYYFLKDFIGKLRNEPILKGKSEEKKILKNRIYNQLILNRWHVMLRLSLNKELISCRRHHLKKKPKIESFSILTRVIQMFLKKMSKK